MTVLPLNYDLYLQSLLTKLEVDPHAKNQGQRSNKKVHTNKQRVGHFEGLLQNATASDKQNFWTKFTLAIRNIGTNMTHLLANKKSFAMKITCEIMHLSCTSLPSI